MREWFRRWSFIVVGLILVALVGFASYKDSHAADRASKGAPWTPTENQRLRIENKQLKAGLVQREFSSVQQRWNDAVAALNAECAAVVKENEWPPDLTCDIQTLQFKEKEKPATPPITKPAKKP